MPSTHPSILNILQCIDLEEKEQIKRYSLDQVHTLRSLKAEGLALHPLTVTRKTYGYADYPEISFKLNFPAETGQFKDGAAIECFLTGQDSVKGVLINLEGRTGEFRLFSPDFPDWIEEAGMGIKLAPDQRTTSIMKTVMNDLQKMPTLFSLFEQLHGLKKMEASKIEFSSGTLSFFNNKLNQSQQYAIEGIVQNKGLVIVHGPPGTGKTTTLTEAVLQLIKKGEKVLVSAPSNTAVDNIAKSLIAAGAGILRVGNSSKADARIFAFTPEGKMGGGRLQKEIKALKIRAEQFRKMALKYKRSFGKAEREQRSLLFKEVKNIRIEIKGLLAYNEEKLFKEADVVLGTPVGLYDAKIKGIKFHSLVMDEAGQCIEPLAWCIFPFAEKYVLAGDHLQLPPTVLNFEAVKKGFNISILEKCIPQAENIYLLDIQYRMRKVIAGFSSSYFYKGLLKTPQELSDIGVHVVFIDTAGTGFNETRGADGTSLQNEGELSIVLKLIENEQLEITKVALIAPYSGQVTAAKELLPEKIRSSTIDNFQGQEMQIIILSLVRSNESGDIGFLKDYRRMNVALTRAKEQLFVIGDSSTIGADNFYNAFLTYIDQNGSYRSAWDFMT